MEREINYTPSAGSKVEYSENNTAWTRIYGLKSVPAIGDEPSKISTTTLDNETYETEVDGLMPAPKMNFEFNMEDPNVEANINLVDKLAKTKKPYYWKITKSNGIVHTYRSKVKYSFKEVQTNQISGFTMYHAPLEEIVTTIPEVTE